MNVYQGTTDNSLILDILASRFKARATPEADVFGIDENLAGPKRQYGAIDVHRIGTAALDLANEITVSKMATQPFNTERIGYVAAGDEQVAPAAKEIGGVEDRFEFSQDI